MEGPVRSHAPVLCLTLGALWATGCAGGEAPAFTHLAVGFEPAAEELVGRRGFWMEVAVAATDWTRDEEAGDWWAPDPFADVALPLVAADGEGRRVVGAAAGEPSFAGDRIRFRAADGESRPAELSLSVFVAVGETYRPCDPGLDPRWRLRVGGLTTDAIPVWPGVGQEVTFAAPADARLRFATSCLGPGADEAAEVVLRLRMNGVPLYETTLARRLGPAVERHEVALPEDVSGVVRLQLSVAGPPSLVTLHDPVVAAAGADPETAAALKDVVLILIDTFRADNLACYGGESDVTPHLDRFAAASRRFENARAPSSWTLPSHGSLLAGVHPYQHGATGKGQGLGAELVTLAERMAAAGYRTGAVTNSVFVSAPYGMDRGFEWFEERLATDLTGTLTSALAFLDADDGRPSFLFVHSYRVHGPYRVQGRTMEEHGVRLGLEEGVRVQQQLFDMLRGLRREHDAAGGAGDRPMQQFIGQRQWPALIEQCLRAEGEEDSSVIAARTAAMLRSLHRLYLGGVLEFDEACGRFLAELDARGAAERTFVIVTSDHGEAFGEHDAVFHGSGTWDEVLRIPLLVRGPGIAAGVDRRHASLVDLPRTVTGLVRVPPAPEWEGRSLFTGSPDLPAFAFDCAETGEPSIAILDGDWKVVLGTDSPGFGLDDVRHLFDLGADPGERRDLADQEQRRAGGLLGLHREELERLLVPLQTGNDVVLDAELLRQMKGLGY